MTTVVDATEEGPPVSSADQALGSAHYWVGLVVLVLVALRLGLRFVAGAPKPADAGPKWMQAAARASHALFYVLLLAMPILGLPAFYLGDPWGDIHALGKPAFIVLIVIHVLAALYHHFWLRDGTLKKMMVPVR